MSVENVENELQRLLSHVTVQDLLLGILCTSEEHRMNSNRVRVMTVLYEHCQHPESVPEKFQDLFESLRTGGREYGFFHGGISMWSDRVESALGFLTLCDGVGWGHSGKSEYYTIDAANAHRYFWKYFPNTTREELFFLEKLAQAINGR